ncbi:hypothetical protein Tco_1333884 [Tanacetum coccineum]
MRESGDGNFNLNSTIRDKENEVQEVRRSRPIGRDHAKRKVIAETSSASSTNAFDVESLAKLMPTQCNSERPLQRSKGPGNNGVIADQKAGARTQGCRAENPTSGKSVRIQSRREKADVTMICPVRSAFRVSDKSSLLRGSGTLGWWGCTITTAEANLAPTTPRLAPSALAPW